MYIGPTPANVDCAYDKTTLWAYIQNIHKSHVGLIRLCTDPSSRVCGLCERGKYPGNTDVQRYGVVFHK